MADTKLDLDQQIQKAAQAKFELEHPLIAEAFDAIEARLTESWKKSKFEDVEGREHLYQTLRALASVKSYLRAVVDDGKVAQAQLDILNKEKTS